uniref:Uncharacterized protein n=1 Tax=Kryptolebias marmoratus TaxID=37003 RepID=A0A3Q2ZY86_KRYMA
GLPPAVQGSPSSWKRHVSEQLKLRDRIQRQTFEEIFVQSDTTTHPLKLSPCVLSPCVLSPRALCPVPLCPVPSVSCPLRSADSARSDLLQQEMAQMRIRHQEELTELHKKRGEVSHRK